MAPYLHNYTDLTLPAVNLSSGTLVSDRNILFAKPDQESDPEEPVDPEEPAGPKDEESSNDVLPETGGSNLLMAIGLLALTEVVYAALKRMGIPYDIVEHPSALTTEEADSYIVGHEGVRTKTLFLCNRKRTAFFLVIMDSDKQLDMKKLRGILHEKSISFCSPEKLMEKMSLPPGVVSLFGS